MSLPDPHPSKRPKVVVTVGPSPFVIWTNTTTNSGKGVTKWV